MKSLLQWFAFWMPAKSIPMAVFQGCIGGLVFGLVVFSPLWITLIEVTHG
jgi:hypothetical protein